MAPLAPVVGHGDCSRSPGASRSGPATPSGVLPVCCQGFPTIGPKQRLHPLPGSNLYQQLARHASQPEHLRQQARRLSEWRASQQERRHRPERHLLLQGDRSIRCRQPVPGRLPDPGRRKRRLPVDPALPVRRHPQSRGRIQGLAEQDNGIRIGLRQDR